MSVQSVDPSPMRSGPYATQPWNQVIFPAVDERRTVWDPVSAMALPSVGRAVNLIAGQVRQMPMDDYRGVTPLPRPRLLDQPDPNQACSWYVGEHVKDYLLHGNAVSYVTAWDSEGWPAACTWLPASWVTIAWDPGDPVYATPGYWVGGRQLDPARVIHVKRGADQAWPVRGVGVVEQHMSALSRVAMAERYEASSLSGSGVPSVAVITPNPRLGKEEADAAKADWMDKFDGPAREPVILPAGTTVVPLAWSPTDAQLTETRKLGLQDVANMFNLDGFYLGAEMRGLTYKSPGPMFLQLVRITLAPILADFEGVWSAAWLPRGRRLRFDRQVLLGDDLHTTIATLAAAVAANLYTLPEARIYLGLPPVAGTDPGVAGPDLTDTNPASTIGGTA